MMLLCAGSVHWDIIARADRAVGRGDDVPGTVRRRPGGVAGNIARHLARLGRPVALAGCIGRDPAGEELCAILRTLGIDLRVHRSEATDSYLAIEQSDGDLVAAVADTAALIRHAAQVVATINACDGPVVVDGNLPSDALAALTHRDMYLVPASPVRAAGLAPLIARGAVPLLNRAEAMALTGREGGTAQLAAQLVEMGARMALVTDGPEPAGLATSRCKISRAPPPITVTAGVTGAGDATVAGFLHAHLSGASPGDALEAALACAAAHLQGLTP